MSRIRTIKPEFWSSEQVMACSLVSRLLFIGLWNFCDDAGRCVNSAKTIKAQIFPGDDDVDSSNVRRMLDELSSNGLLQKYEVEGRSYLQVTGWQHQKIDRPRPSKCPPPNFDDHSSNARRPFATDLTLSYPNNILSSTAARAREAKATATDNPAVGPATAPLGSAPSRPPGTTNGEAKEPPPKEVQEETQPAFPPGTIVGPEVLRVAKVVGRK